MGTPGESQISSGLPEQSPPRNPHPHPHLHPTPTPLYKTATCLGKVPEHSRPWLSYPVCVLGVRGWQSVVVP